MTTQYDQEDPTMDHPTTDAGDLDRWDRYVDPWAQDESEEKSPEYYMKLEIDCDRMLEGLLADMADDPFYWDFDEERVVNEWAELGLSFMHFARFSARTPQLGCLEEWRTSPLYKGGPNHRKARRAKRRKATHNRVLNNAIDLTVALQRSGLDVVVAYMSQRDVQIVSTCGLRIKVQRKKLLVHQSSGGISSVVADIAKELKLTAVLANF